MEKMLVTQALNELNLLDARIQRETNIAKFITAAKTNEKNVTPNVTKEEFGIRAKASYQSILDLIKRRDAIKKAIVASNAVTEVTINGETMTVASAIELKTSIEYEAGLLVMMKNQYERAKSDVGMQNIRLQEKIDTFISQNISGKEAKTKKDDYAALVDPIRTAGEYSLVDPLHIEDKIRLLEERIEGFRANVDSALQISNCTTLIEF